MAIFDSLGAALWATQAREQLERISAGRDEARGGLTPTPFGAQAPIADRVQVDAALLQSGQEWEQQRITQAGQVDRVGQSALAWERQRLQQGGASE